MAPMIIYHFPFVTIALATLLPSTTLAHTITTTINPEIPTIQSKPSYPNHDSSTQGNNNNHPTSTSNNNTNEKLLIARRNLENSSILLQFDQDDFMDNSKSSSNSGSDDFDDQDDDNDYYDKDSSVSHASAAPPSSIITSSSSSYSLAEGDEEECVATNECMLCPQMDPNHVQSHLNHFEECEATQRRREFLCVVTHSDNTISKHKTFKSCQRTQSDENIRMIHFQLACLVLSLLSISSVRKEKVATASLFDLRSMKKFTVSANNGSSAGAGAGAGAGDNDGIPNEDHDNDNEDDECIPLSKHVDGIHDSTSSSSTVIGAGASVGSVNESNHSMDSKGGGDTMV